MVNSQQTIDTYDSCWQIESQSQCESYNDQYGCYWDEFDQSCMCRIKHDNINIIYLIDISLSGLSQLETFSNIAATIQDVTDSTLMLQQTSYYQTILYNDKDIYVQTPYIDITTIDISQYEQNHSQISHLSSAINTAISIFQSLNNKKRNILIILIGQTTSNTQNICSLKAALNSQCLYLSTNAI